MVEDIFNMGFLLVVLLINEVVQEKEFYFLKFSVIPIWLPDHVTDDVFVITLVSPKLVDHWYEFLHRAIKLFWRRLNLKVHSSKKYIRLSDHVTDDA